MRIQQLLRIQRSRTQQTAGADAEEEKRDKPDGAPMPKRARIHKKQNPEQVLKRPSSAEGQPLAIAHPVILEVKPKKGMYASPTGLKSRPDLNGKLCQIIDQHEDRFVCHVVGACENANIKSENLVMHGEDPTLLLYKMHHECIIDGKKILIKPRSQGHPQPWTPL